MFVHSTSSSSQLQSRSLFLIIKFLKPINHLSNTEMKKIKVLRLGFGINLGQEAGVGSRKSSRRSAWWAGGTGRCRSVKAVNPQRAIQLREPRGAEQA